MWSGLAARNSILVGARVVQTRSGWKGGKHRKFPSVNLDSCVLRLGTSRAPPYNCPAGAGDFNGITGCKDLCSYFVKNTLCIIVAATLLTGCAGTYFTFDKAREIKVGMTGADIQQIMGRPYMVTTSAGKEIWVYTYATGFGSVRSVSYILRDGKVVEVPEIPGSFGGQTRSAVATP